MDDLQWWQGFVRTTASGALPAFDATVILGTLAIAVSYIHDPRSLVYREPLLIWLPFALAALALALLTLAAGIGGAIRATHGGRGWWATTLRVLVVLAIVMPVFLYLSKDSFQQAILAPVIALIYLVLPLLALLSAGRRAYIRLLSIQTFIAYGVAIVCIVLTYRFPRFGMGPTQVYFIYFPPQLFVAAVMCATALLFSLAGGIICTIDGRLSGRPLWSDCFLVAVAVCLAVPLLLAMQIHYPPLVSVSPSLTVVLGIAAGAAYLALPGLVLVYAHRSRPASAPPHIGAPGVNTSL